MLPRPRICCLDLDTFFVSVERLLDPSLIGRPVIVGGRPGSRGVVTACSYEVRELGVHSGMSLTEAARLAPDAVYLPVRGDTYGRYSREVRETVERYSPVVQAASIDEMFIDFSGCERLHRRSGDFGDDATILGVVRQMTAAIRDELGLPASAGIATSRKVAKVASGLAKPAGVLMVPAGAEARMLALLPVRKLPGIGPVGEARLTELGIETLGELAETPLEELRPLFGAWAEEVLAGAQGRGSADISRDQPAFREHDESGDLQRSISNERTFREDTADQRTVDAQLCFLCERVCWRARNRGVRARTVSLKLRYADFETLSRSLTVPPTCSELEVYPIVKGLYQRARRRRTPIRLLGVALSNLVPIDRQLGLFEDVRRLDRSLDAIREKYGFDAVRRATGRLGAAGRRRRRPAPA
ncbi:MAG TPA: DNA polymerase IV [Thermoanaerobaculia bacterium]|nr:DNA polymerase IV [Thermoanaerobaculia bacterium]